MLLTALWLITAAHAVELFEERAFYVGDLHVHSGVSGDGVSSDLNKCDPCEALADVPANARNRGLDFVALADHVNGNFAAEVETFSTAFEMMLDANDPENGFITVPAVELHFKSNNKKLGHKNLYLFAPNEDLEDIQLADLQYNDVANFVPNCSFIWNWFTDFKARWGNALLIPHHPAPVEPMPTAWECEHSVAQPVVEMYSQHGNSLRTNPDYDPSSAGYRASGTVAYALTYATGTGIRLGFISSTDNHRTQPGHTCTTDAAITKTKTYGGGLTMLVLDEAAPFSRAAISGALLSRSVYATSGPEVPVLFEALVDEEVIGQFGDAVEVNSNQTIDFQVRFPTEYNPYVLGIELLVPDLATGYLDSVAMSEAQTGVWTTSIEGAPKWAAAILLLDGEAWYGADGCDDGGTTEERIWMSPIFFITSKTTGDTADTAAPPDTAPPDTATTETGKPDTSPEDTDTSSTDSAPDTSLSKPDGCGCASTAPTGSLALLALGLTALTRRRRGAGVVGLALLSGCANTSADKLFHSATFHVDATTETHALAVTDGVVVALGDDAEAMVGRDTKQIGLNDHTVMPGFQDSHTHLLAGSFAMDRLLLMGVSSMDGLVGEVTEYLDEVGDDPWIVGYGWQKDLLDENPTGEALNTIDTALPMILVNGSGHSALVNQIALDRAGIDADTPDPDDGTIGRDENGDPNGFLDEGALALVSEPMLADYDESLLTSGLETTLEDFARSGLTGAAEIMALPGFDLTRPWIYADLEAEGRLPIRITWYAPIFEASDIADAVDLAETYTSDMLRFGGGKLWVDGSMSGGSAWTSEPYLHDAAHFGDHYFSQDELNAIVSDAESQGMPLKLHVNGDAAVESALLAFEASSPLTVRHVLDHIVLLDDEQRARMAALGLIASIQTTHYLPSTMGDTADNWGDARFDTAYNYGGFVEAGVDIALGTDWPVWPNPEPMVGVWAGATQRGDDANLTLSSSLWGYISGSAKALNAEDSLGCLRVGCFADFVVFDEDPQNTPVEDLTDLTLVNTYVSGRAVP